MHLVRRQPVTTSPFTDVERLFDSFFSGSRTAAVGRPWSPAIDVTETEEEIVLSADLPGLGEDDVAVEVEDGVLTVSGERRDERSDSDEKTGYRRVERSFGRFSRALRLPRGTDPENVTADFDRGVLEVRIAKPESPKAHKVAIGRGEDEREAIEGEAERKD